MKKKIRKNKTQLWERGLSRGESEHFDACCCPHRAAAQLLAPDARLPTSCTLARTGLGHVPLAPPPTAPGARRSCSLGQPGLSRCGNGMGWVSRRCSAHLRIMLRAVAWRTPILGGHSSEADTWEPGRSSALLMSNHPGTVRNHLKHCSGRLWHEGRFVGKPDGLEAWSERKQGDGGRVMVAGEPRASSQWHCLHQHFAPGRFLPSETAQAHLLKAYLLPPSRHPFKALSSVIPFS